MGIQARFFKRNAPHDDVIIDPEDDGITRVIGNLNVSGGIASPNIVSVTTVLVAPASILTLDSIPVTLVPAQGEDTIIVPVSVVVIYHTGDTAFNDVAAISISYDNIGVLPFSLGNLATNGLTSKIIASSELSYSGVSESIVNNKSIVLYTDAPVTGPGTGHLHVATSWYFLSH